MTDLATAHVVRNRLSFPLFVDRPPMHDGLPSQARHLCDVFPEWWREQSKRGWPKDSQHAVFMLAVQP
jgi:hypothetical protein